MPRMPAPSCEKCAAEMRLVASMPPISVSGRGATVFRCDPCKAVKWIDWAEV